MRNQRSDPCRHCGLTVYPGEGRLVRQGGVWLVEHRYGDECGATTEVFAAPVQPRATCAFCLEPHSGVCAAGREEDSRIRREVEDYKDLGRVL